MFKHYSSEKVEVSKLSSLRTTKEDIYFHLK